MQRTSAAFASLLSVRDEKCDRSRSEAISNAKRIPADPSARYGMSLPLSSTCREPSRARVVKSRSHRKAFTAVICRLSSPKSKDALSKANPTPDHPSISPAALREDVSKDTIVEEGSSVMP